MNTAAVETDVLEFAEEVSHFRLITYAGRSGARAGIVSGDSFVDAADATGIAGYASTDAILMDWDAATEKLAGAAGQYLLCRRQLLDHVLNAAKATGMAPEPEPHGAGLKPWHFIKPFSTVVGDKTTIAVVSSKLGYEAELAVVIGRTARNVSVATALDHVAGYTIANDLSARDLISRTGVAEGSPFRYDWIGQKCFDGSCPLGPFIVPAAAVPDPQALSILLTVNGRVRQQSNTSLMLFSIAEQIAHLSSRLTLQPGDVILTGTPAGTALEGGDFLQPGDVIRIEIEYLGQLTTTIGSITG